MWLMDQVVNGMDIEAAVLELELGGIVFVGYCFETLNQQTP